MAIDDSPFRRGEIAAAPTWTPDNSDNVYKACCPPRTVDQFAQHDERRIGERAGVEHIVRVAESPLRRGAGGQPAIYLGAFETTLSDLTAAIPSFPMAACGAELVIAMMMPRANDLSRGAYRATGARSGDVLV